MKYLFGVFLFSLGVVLQGCGPKLNNALCAAGKGKCDQAAKIPQSDLDKLCKGYYDTEYAKCLAPMSNAFECAECEISADPLVPININTQSRSNHLDHLWRSIQRELNSFPISSVEASQGQVAPPTSPPPSGHPLEYAQKYCLSSVNSSSNGCANLQATRLDGGNVVVTPLFNFPKEASISGGNGVSTYPHACIYRPGNVSVPASCVFVPARAVLRVKQPGIY